MRRRLTIFIALIVVVIAVIAAIRIISSHRTVTIEFKNAHNVKIVTNSNAQDGDSPDVIATITKSGDSAWVDTGISYAVVYDGNDGYKSDEVNLSDNATTVIDPDFSDDKYKQFISQEKPTIDALIINTYPASQGYQISSDSMFEKGKWYSVKLTFKGEYDYYTDDLRVVLEKKGMIWGFATKPEVILTTAKYPTIPQSVLSKTNDL